MNEAQSTKVVILSKAFRTVGYISLMPGGRLTDYMDTPREFLAITNAEVSQLCDGKIILTSDFLNIRKDSIEIILPADQQRE